MVEPRFCETLQCFHHILGDMTLPEGTKKQKSKPSEISVNFGYDKNKPNTDFLIRRPLDVGEGATRLR